MLQYKTIEKLRGHSLFIDEKPLFPETHVAYPSGYVVSKSAEIVENGHESSESFFTDASGEEVKSNSPSIFFWYVGGCWNIEVRECVPGPGPYDFCECFSTEDEAAERIIRYFFDPEDPMFILFYREAEKSAKNDNS